MTTVAERLQYLLETRDMKQTELAEKIGISKQSLYKYLHCMCEPRSEVIAKMAAALSTSADFIVGLTAEDFPKKGKPEHEACLRQQTELLAKIQKLTPENRIRMIERLDCLLEEQNRLHHSEIK